MDAFCGTLRSASHLANPTKSVFCGEENGFWGEMITWSLSNRVGACKIGKKLNLEERGRKIKPGVAYSVLTRENSNQTLVSICLSLFMST